MYTSHGDMLPSGAASASEWSDIVTVALCRRRKHMHLMGWDRDSRCHQTWTGIVDPAATSIGPIVQSATSAAGPGLKTSGPPPHGPMPVPTQTLAAG